MFITRIVESGKIKHYMGDLIHDYDGMRETLEPGDSVVLFVRDSGTFLATSYGDGAAHLRECGVAWNGAYQFHHGDDGMWTVWELDLTEGRPQEVGE